MRQNIPRQANSHIQKKRRTHLTGEGALWSYNCPPQEQPRSKRCSPSSSWPLWAHGASTPSGQMHIICTPWANQIPLPGAQSQFKPWPYSSPTATQNFTEIDGNRSPSILCNFLPEVLSANRLLFLLSDLNLPCLAFSNCSSEVGFATGHPLDLGSSPEISHTRTVWSKLADTTRSSEGWNWAHIT